MTERPPNQPDWIERLMVAGLVISTLALVVAWGFQVRDVLG
jgi:hypothetical protein